MLYQALLALTSLAGIVAGQIDPNSVPLSTRQSWCQYQTSTCPLICLDIKGASGSPESNSCDPKSLSYSCVCSNGITPNASEYTETLPYFICTETNNQCVNNCNGVSSCQSACREDHPCGAQDPPHINATTATPTAAASTAASTNTDVVYQGFGTATATTTSQKGMSPRAFAIDLGQVYGLFVVVGGFLAGFLTLI
ncbi:hypothetical protein MAP00_003046 [Monascus purpureus]|nr:hypothetical protein MAP00_003046 [Monascus purpureus]